jgi:DNA-binding MarR family transcriptional regulator
MGKQKPFAVLGPEADEVGDFLRALYRLHKGIGRQISPVLEQRHDIDLKLYLVMKRVEGGVVHPTDIAQSSQEPASVVTRQLADLIGRGLLIRAVDAFDARRFRLSLTPEGAATLAAADRALAGMVGDRLGTLGAAERATFIATLTALAEDFDTA